MSGTGASWYGMDVCPDLPGKGALPEQQLAGSAYWIPEPLFGSLLNAILKQLRRAGFRIVVGHGHGPSTTYFPQPRCRVETDARLECFICLGSDVDKDGLGIQVDHAAMERDLSGHGHAPDLVQMERLPARSLPVSGGGLGKGSPRVRPAPTSAAKPFRYRPSACRDPRDALERANEDLVVRMPAYYGKMDSGRIIATGGARRPRRALRKGGGKARSAGTLNAPPALEMGTIMET